MRRRAAASAAHHAEILQLYGMAFREFCCTAVRAAAAAHHACRIFCKNSYLKSLFYPLISYKIPYKNIVKLYPDEQLFGRETKMVEGMISLKDTNAASLQKLEGI